MIAVDTVITYNHPDWGPSTGTVLANDAPDGRILVQDHAPNGAREWIEPAWIEVPDA